MKAYQIKVTYLSGRNVGKSYVLTKSGYVAHDGIQSEYYCYTSLRAAKSMCTRYTKKNKECFDDETIELERRIAKGLSVRDWRIHELCKYEPIEVECY